MTEANVLLTGTGHGEMLLGISLLVQKSAYLNTQCNIRSQENKEYTDQYIYRISSSYKYIITNKYKVQY